MSLEENPIEDSDVGQKVIESENKPAKDRKNRKDKVKPLAKVMFEQNSFRLFVLDWAILIYEFSLNEIHAAGCYSTSSTHND